MREQHHRTSGMWGGGDSTATSRGILAHPPSQHCSFAASSNIPQYSAIYWYERVQLFCVVEPLGTFRRPSVLALQDGHVGAPDSWFLFCGVFPSRCATLSSHHACRSSLPWASLFANITFQVVFRVDLCQGVPLCWLSRHTRKASKTSTSHPR